MLTRFVSDSAWEAPEYVYPYDKTVQLKNEILYTAGNLNANVAPFLQNLQDVSNNNYSLFYLTDKKYLDSLFTVKQPYTNDLINNYTCILGVYAENGRVVENSLFLECQPLYHHENSFKFVYATSNEGVLGLSGRSAVFSSAFPLITGYEMIFKVNGNPAVSNTVFEKRLIDVTGASMQTAAHQVSSYLNNTFCEFVSGSVRTVTQKQTFKLTLSAQGRWDPSTFRGFGLGLGSTKLNTSYPYEKFFVMFNVNGFRQQPPASFSVDEIMTIPRLGTTNLPFFTPATPVYTVVHSLTSLFRDVPIPIPPEDILEYDNGLYPLSGSFEVLSTSYDNKGLTMTIRNKLPGSVTIYPYAWAPFGENGNIFDIEVLTEGFDAGFDLQFKPTSLRSETPLELPMRYYTVNTRFKKPTPSNLGLDIYNFNIKETFKPDFYKLVGFNNNIFLDFNIINDRDVTITHTRYNKKVYLICDDFSQKVYFLGDERINDSNIVLTRFNYLFDSTNKSIIVYRMIRERMFALSKIGSEVGLREIQNLTNIDADSIFYILNFNDIGIDFQKNMWVGYDKKLKLNDLNINPAASTDIQNNFLYHTEYNKIKNNIEVNMLPLKNQLNEFYKQNFSGDGVDFRSYHSIYTGDNRETGTNDISLGYITDTTEYILKAGEITWFHLPYNESYKRISIHDTNFLKNGAVYGLSPLFSDKIWKKEGSYKYTSNLGDSNREQTGQWLCAWLSGSTDSDAIWVDRFYNPELITEAEAIKVTNNLDYIPSYTAYNYTPGITDTKSRMTMEPGVWYAYNHIGKKDALHVVEFLKEELVQSGIIGIAPTGIGDYAFAGDKSGYISLKNFKSPNNSFTLSFFGYTDNWSRPFGGQFIGNYLDAGFGVFNYRELNPLRFYYNLNKVDIYNNESEKILTIEQPPSLSGMVIDVFRREYFENFHLVLDNYNILEYNLQGTLVDVVSSDTVVKLPIISTSNNLIYGVLLYDNYSYSIIDLRTNEVSYVRDNGEAVFVNFENPVSYVSVCIDTFRQVYIINGTQPFIREDKIYYLSNENLRHLKVFNTVSKENVIYLDTTTLEVSATPQRVVAYYTNLDQTVTEFPYKSFSLRGLSGAGMSLFAPIPDLTEYNLGFSIYKDPYIYTNSTTLQKVSATGQRTINVDLHGNYWYKHTELEPPDWRNWEEWGQSGFINNSNQLFIGDPEWQERIGSSIASYGRVFVYSLSSGRLNSAVSFNKAPREQRSILRFSVEDPDDTLLFPISSGFVFYQGYELLAASGFSNLNHLLSSFSLAFKTTNTQAVHPGLYVTENTRRAEVSLTRLTNAGTILNELSAWFNRPIFSYPGGTLALSSFYDFVPTVISPTTFTIEVRHRYPGVNLNPDFPLRWGTTVNNYGYDPFSFTLTQQGSNTAGIRGEKFGAQVRTTSYFDLDEPDPLFQQVTVISSPGWTNPTGLPEVGKVALYQNLFFAENDTFSQNLQPFEIINPVATSNQRFGYSLALSAVLLENRYGMVQMLVAAPASVAEAYPGFNSESRVYLYDIDVTNNIQSTSTALCSFRGRTADGWGRKVDMYGDKFGISMPLRDVSGVRDAGAVNMFTLERQYIRTFAIAPGVSADEFIRPPYGLLSAYDVAVLNNPYPTVNSQFGYDISVHKNEVAIACLSSTVAGFGNLACFVYSFTARPLIVGQSSDTYTLKAVLTAEFLNRRLTTDESENMRVSVAINDNHLSLGGWVGDPSTDGGDVGKVAIWFKKNGQYYKMYDQPSSRTPEITSRNYYGSYMSMVDDRIATGTMFVYNTGNTTHFAASAISAAIRTQTDIKNGYEAAPLRFDKNAFFVTITSRLSSEVMKEAVVYDVLNTDYNLTTFNEFVKAFNYNGTALIYSGDIMDYAFDTDENTIILTDYNRFKRYNALGSYTDTVFLNERGLVPNLSCLKLSLETTLNSRDINQTYALYGVDEDLHNYYLNYNPSNDQFTYAKIDEIRNDYYTGLRNRPGQQPNINPIRNFKYDINNSKFTVSNIRLKFPEPTISFKLRLNNRLDYEESEILSPSILTDDLSPGWHHFAVVFDSIAGLFRGYVDTLPVFTIEVVPNKYVFSNVLIDNMLVGSVPYFNNTTFNNFYRSKTANFYADGINIDKINFYNKALNISEIKFLQYEKFQPSDLNLQVQFGERNYVDVVSRVMKHKIPGQKSPYIDIHISDSLVTDLDLQKFYEMKILRELREYLPSYVRINKIVWNASKPPAEKIIQGDINVGNTLTNSGGTE